MKCSILLSVLVLVGGLTFAQSNNTQQSTAESADVDSHGKAISELAKATPGGPEKGKLISSAACRKSIQGGAVSQGNRPEHFSNARNDHSNKAKPSPSPNSATGRGKPPGTGLVK